MQDRNNTTAQKNPLNIRRTQHDTEVHHLRRYAEIGMALSGEENVSAVFEMIVTEAREITGADAGTLYLVNNEQCCLDFTVLHNDTMKTRMGGTSGNDVGLPPVPLSVSGEPNHANVSSHVALTGDIVNIEDVYTSSAFDFTGPRRYDENTGYRSKSMLVIPMRDHEGIIIGVLQLLNAQDIHGNTTVFSDEHVVLTASLASQAAAALTKSRLIDDLKDLFHSFIKGIAEAVEEKSPYTGGHINRVVDLTMMMAEAVNKSDEGPFADERFSEDEMEELRLAAWLHDVGKITTPESVIDKSTKLETVFDRAELVRTRFDLIAKITEAEFLRRKVEVLEQVIGQDVDLQTQLVELNADMENALHRLQEEKSFVLGCNTSDEFMDDDRIAKLEAVGAKTYDMAGEQVTYLTEDEVKNLSIRKGTLTDEERKLVEHHAVMTGKILGKLSFPKKFDRVPEYAAGHHERPDGSGYPLGLQGTEIPLQARIMAVADIFEALTAKDRPYKKPMTLSQAVRILGFLKRDGHIDADVHDLFISSGMFKLYAERELDEWQIDDVRLAPCLTGRKVLVAVADREDAEKITTVLCSWGAEVDVVRGHLDAVSAMTDHWEQYDPYRLVVADAACTTGTGFRTLLEDEYFPAWSILTLGHVQDMDIALRLGGVVEDIEDMNALGSLALDILKRPKAKRPAVDRAVRMDKSDTVLVVDPSAYTRMLLSYFLSDVGMRTEGADHAGQALRLLEKGRYAVVVADNRLSDLDESALRRSIRRVEGNFDDGTTPVLFMCNGDPVRKADLQGGAETSSTCGPAYIEKPVQKEALLAAISAFGRKSDAGPRRRFHHADAL